MADNVTLTPFEINRAMHADLTDPAIIKFPVVQGNQLAYVLGVEMSMFGGLPDQTGQAGKFLMTNGTSAVWSTVSGGGTPGGNQFDIQTNDGAGGFSADDGFSYDGSVVTINNNPGSGSGWGNIQLAINSASTEAGLQLGNYTVDGHRWNIISAGTGSDINPGSFSIGDATLSVNRLSIDTSGYVYIPVGLDVGNGKFFVGLAGSVGQMQYSDGNEALGKVLTSDASGYATWQTATASLTATYIGYGDGSNLLTGDDNFVRFGFGIGLQDNADNLNIFLGVADGIGSGNNSTTGIQNIGIGIQSSVALTTGVANIGIGNNTLATNATGSQLICIGSYSDAGSDGLTNSIALGANTNITTSNQFIVGGITSSIIDNWLIAGINYIMPSSLLMAGAVLTDTDGAGTLEWTLAAAGLTSTQVGFGSASNLLTGDPNYTYDNVNNVFNVGFPNVGGGVGNFLSINMPTNLASGIIQIGDINGIIGGPLMVFDSIANTVTFTSAAMQIDTLNNGGVVTSVFGTGRLISTQATGWGTPTGTLSRTAFDSTTITYLELAQKVAALITDLETLTALRS